MKTFGTTLRQLREDKGLLLRQVAAQLEIDTALLSKVERGERNLKREQVVKAAKIFDMPNKELLVLWLADKISGLVKDEEHAIDALTITISKLKKNSKKTK